MIAVESSSPAEQSAIGSKMTLYCDVQPEPPKGTTYAWSSSVNGDSIHIDDNSFPNATVSIPVHHPSVGHYYCHVYVNGAQIGTGSIVVKVLGECSNCTTLRYLNGFELKANF